MSNPLGNTYWSKFAITLVVVIAIVNGLTRASTY